MVIFLIRCNFNNVYTSTQSIFEFQNGQLKSALYKLMFMFSFRAKKELPGLKEGLVNEVQL